MEHLFMKQAIIQAKKALKKDEVPIGAVIVKDGVILSRGYNRTEADQDATRHAEIIAIERACKKLKSWRLDDCTLYVTVEPCPMCAGAIVNSRIDRVVFGAHDQKAGAYGSVFDMCAYPLNHIPVVEGGVLEERCANQLSSFFKNLRKKKKSDKND